MTVESWVEWFVNDVPLQTFAFNIADQGRLMGPPPLRGDDTTIPYQPGRTFTERIPDSRTLVLDMWVIGTDQDGNLPQDDTIQAQFFQNLTQLRKLFWNAGEQFRLTKKWREFGSDVVRSATAMGVYADGFAPALQGASRGTFTVDVFLSNPFFRDDAPRTLSFFSTTNSAVEADIEGDYKTSDIEINIAGSPVRPRFDMGDQFLLLDRTIVTSAKVDIAKWTALMGTTNIVRNVKWGNSVNWLSLKPGRRTIQATSGGGSGSATLTYTPLWI